MISLRGCLLAVTLCASPLCAQRTWILDASGGGDFTTLDAAYATMRAGDTLLVRAGIYFPRVADKEVTVLADDGVDFLGMFSIAEDLGVRNLPAGERFVIRGGNFTRYPHTLATFLVGG